MKTPYAAISGYVKDLDVENIRSVAAQLLDDPEWVQLGFDPRRQGKLLRTKRKIKRTYSRCSYISRRSDTNWATGVS